MPLNAAKLDSDEPRRPAALNFEPAFVSAEERARSLDEARGYLRAKGMREPEIEAYMVNVAQAMESGYTVRSDTHQVTIWKVEVEGWPALFHLSIKRNDREPIHDWRDLQAIKNALVGPEHEGVELYPAESRRVDTANQYHLFVIAEPGQRFPFGFTDRMVTDDKYGRAKQRPFTEGTNR